jgi:translation initiation factor 6
MLGKGLIFGNPYLGVFCAANESTVLIPHATEADFPAVAGRFLGVGTVIRASVDGCSTIGALVSMNSNGAVAPASLTEAETRILSKAIRVTRIDDRHNAMGNNVLANDNGALVHPGFSEEAVQAISEALKVPVSRGTVAGYSTVGSAAVATNRGVICHPHTSAKELEVLESVLGVKAQICTANYGTGQVGACMVANTKGALVGETTTPIELGRIEDGLMLY